MLLRFQALGFAGRRVLSAILGLIPRLFLLKPRDCSDT